MSELRQDRTSGGWVIIAPRRGRRPQMREPGTRPQSRPRFDPACPFCPGNEAQLPGIIAEVAASNPPKWYTRVVPNKYPALQLRQEWPLACGDHQTRPGHGVQEVIIESPWHNAELATMSVAELKVVASVYRARSRTLLEQDGIKAAILFRNFGRSAGASLMHPHAQLIALDFVPPKIAMICDAGKRYYTERGHCAMCDELAAERNDGTRIVDENDCFLTLLPFAAEHPFELWVVPKRHQPSFTALPDAELGDLADLLRRALHRLRVALDDPPYNFVIDSAPKGELVAPHWHWRLRVVPDVVTWGGFELGAGLPINPSSPEDDARLLRAADAGP